MAFCYNFPSKLRQAGTVVQQYAQRSGILSHMRNDVTEEMTSFWRKPKMRREKLNEDEQEI